jgi:ABC-type transport system involved in multi-copper enzyme maturation permease subunit
MRGIVKDTVTEMFDRKVHFLFIVMTLVAVVAALIGSGMDIELNMSGANDMQSVMELMGNPITRGISVFLWLMVFLTVMASAGLIPTMFMKGRADFYLSKPVSRTALLLNKLLAIWLVYGGAMVISGLIVYCVMVAVYGLFDGKVVFLFVLNLVRLFIWLSITVTVGIVSGSTTMSIIAAFLTWVAQLLLRDHNQIKAFFNSQPVGYVIDTLYYIIPKMGEIGELTDSLALGKPIESWQPLFTSLMFAVVLVYVATIVFNRKDY